MTPKEKAKDLYDSYWYCLLQSNIEKRNYWSQQCALIAVDEILKCEATEPTDTDWDDCGSTAQYYWPQKKEDAGKFWGEVKQELELL